MEVFEYVLKGVYVLILLFLILRRKKLGKNIHIIILAILITIIAEFLSGFLLNSDPNTNTTPYYAILVLGIVYTLFFVYFYSLTQGKVLKKIQLLLLAAYVMNYGASILLNKDFFNIFPQITNFIGIILLLFSIVVFFRDIFDSDRILVIKNYYPFWVGVSLIVIYVGILPILIFGARVDTPINIIIFKTVILSVNMLGYLLMLLTIFSAKDIENKLN